MGEPSYHQGLGNIGFGVEYRTEVQQPVYHGGIDRRVVVKVCNKSQGRLMADYLVAILDADG